MNELRAGVPLAVGGSILIPIEGVTVRVETVRYGHWFSATKEVVALVVCGPDGLRTIDVQARAQPRALEQFIREIPGLAAVIRKCAMD